MPIMKAENGWARIDMGAKSYLGKEEPFSLSAWEIGIISSFPKGDFLFPNELGGFSVHAK